MSSSRARLYSVVAALFAGFALWAQAPEPAGAAKGKGKGKIAEPADPAASGGAANAKGKGRGGAAVAEKAPTPPPIPQVLRLVRSKLYMVTGHGANLLFKITPAGVIVVDTKLPSDPLTGEDNFGRFMELIKGVTDQPVKAVYNTHHHQDHTGNNDKFLALGVPVIAPEALKTALAKYSAIPKPAAPSVTFASSHITRLGGVEAQAYHYGPGHTGGDCVVFFPADKLIALGDLVTVGRAPVIDYAGGASLLHWVQSLDQVLKLDWTVAVPGNGDPVDRSYVETYRKNLQALIDRARVAIARGVTKEQILAQVKTDDLGWSLQMDADRLNGFYAELSAK